MKKSRIFFSDWNKTYSRLGYNIYISQLQYISKSTYAPQNVDNLERTGICISRRDTFLDHLYRWSKTRFLHKLEDIPVFWFLDFARPDFVIALGPKNEKQTKQVCSCTSGYMYQYGCSASGLGTSVQTNGKCEIDVT